MSCIGSTRRRNGALLPLACIFLISTLALVVTSGPARAREIPRTPRMIAGGNLYFSADDGTHGDGSSGRAMGPPPGP